MDKKNNNSTTNNQPLSPEVVASPVAMTGLGSGAVALVNHFKYKTLPHTKSMLEYSSPSTYYQNKRIKMLDKAREATSEEERKKYIKEAGKYNYAAKHDDGWFGESWSIYASAKTKKMKDPEFMEQLRKEVEVAKEMERKKLEQEINKALKKRNVALGLMGLSFLGAGLTYAHQNKKQKEHLQSLVKQSSDEVPEHIKNIGISDKEYNNIKKQTAENKSSFVPATAAAMYAAGVGADKIADKLNESYSKKESMYKKHLADVNSLSKEKEKIYERLNSEGIKPSEEAALYKRLEELNLKLTESASKARTFAGQIAMNPANALKTQSSTLKWGALPLAIAGAYQISSKNINPDKTGLIKDPQTNDKVNVAAKALEAAGVLAMTGGMYRPVIKPMLKGIEGIFSKNSKLLTDKKEEMDKIEKLIKNTKDEDLLSSRKRNEAIENLEKGKEKTIEQADKFKYDKDAKIAAIGSTMLSAGLVGDNITASPEETDRTVYQYANKKKLLKQSNAIESVLGAAETAGTPLGGHVAQNLYIKGQLHSGALYKKFNRHLLEGNKDKVSKSVLSHLGDGAVEGLLNPDAHVIKNEARELGKLLKEKGVDFERLGPEDKIFLKALSKGDYAKALDVAPHSGVAHMFFATNAAKQNAAIQELTGKAQKNLSKKDWEKVNKAFKDTAMYQLGRVVEGKDPDKYLPPRKHGVMTNVYNKIFQKLNNEKDKKSLVGKVYKFLGKDVDDVLHLPKKELSVEEAKKLEEKGRIPSIALLTTVEPLLGAWNAGKPLISKTNLANKYTSLDATQYFTRGLLNDDISKVDRKTYLSDAASDYLLSPSLGMVNRLAYDEGKIHNEILRRGLSKKTAKKALDNDKIKEYARNPWAAERNRQVDNIKSELGLEKMEDRLKTFDKGLLHDYKKSGDKVLKDALNTRSVDPKKVRDEFEVPLNKTFDKTVDKGTKDLGTKDLKETEKISEVGKKYNDLMSDWGAPGAVAVGLGLVSPAVYGDYKQYRDKRRKNLKKTASDNTDSKSDYIGLGTGALAGGITGGILGKLENEKQIEDAQALVSKLQLLKDSDPIEAKEILERLKKDKPYQYIKDMEAIKKIEKEIDKHHKEVMNNIKNSPEAKKLKEYEQMVEKFRVKNPQPEGAFKSLIIRPVKEAASYLASKGKKDITKEIPKNIYDIKNAKEELENKIIDRNAQIKKKLNKSFEEGDLYKAYLEAQKEVGKHIKPSKSKIIGKGLAGAGAGAVLAYLADKTYNKLSHIHKDGDPRNETDYKISPFVGTGLIAGGLLGLATNKMKSRIIKEFADRNFDNDFISPRAKIETMKHLGALTDLENTTNAAIEESAKHYHGKVPSYSKIQKSLDADTKSFNVRKAKDMAVGAGLGGVAGYMYGNDINTDKKNNIATTQMLLHKHSSDSDKDNTDKLIYTGLIGTGAGAGTFLGYKAGKIKKTKLTPAFENIKQTVNMHIKDGDKFKHYKDFTLGYDTPETINSIKESLNKFKAGKNVFNEKDVKKRAPLLNQYKDLQEKVYQAEENYLPREKELTQLQDLYKELATHKKAGNAKAYSETIEKIKNIRAPKDKSHYSKVEQALNDFLNAKEELRDSDVVNKYKHIDFKLLHQTNKKIPEIENELKSIPRKGAIKGGLAGTAIGSALAYLAYKDLNSPE